MNILLNTQAKKDELKNMLKNKIFPDHADTYNKIAAFIKKFKGFKYNAEDDTVIYTPHNLIVVDDEDEVNILNSEFKEHGLGKGSNHFYKYIQNKYIGITRNDVEEFMKTNGMYQTGLPKKHRTNKPVIANLNDYLVHH